LIYWRPPVDQVLRLWIPPENNRALPYGFEVFWGRIPGRRGPLQHRPLITDAGLGMLLPATPIEAAILAWMLLILKFRVNILAGSEPDSGRRMSVPRNSTEYVPIALVLIEIS